ncbi:hypothetical protein ACJ72_01607 [Emergomyces africanus]|uniref:SET domain-containing protein n=1 Tax=Emergomyces africanus TaxID=1955775 RepID=A0A1B7P4Q7_9EURO|nr:hypothetical protein ACJ72_01607 [Emergomyces africanus]
MLRTSRIACTDPRAEAKQTSDKGLGLFATSQVRPGDNIFAITANFATVLHADRINDTCSNCFACTDDDSRPDFKLILKACTGCHVVKYCDRMEKGGEQIERVTVSARALKDISNTDIELSTLVAYFAMLDTNAFTLTNQNFEPIGLCLLPFAAYINHSCEPNAYVGFDGQVMFLKALQDIAADDEIFISYIDNTHPFKIRQSELQERYFFECKCPKCQKGTTAREDQYLTPEGPFGSNPENTVLKLLRTSKIPGETPEALFERLDLAFTLLNNTGCWPITRQPFPQLLDELVVELVSAKCYKSAFLPAAIRYLLIDPVLYPSRIHPIRKRNTWALSKLLKCVSFPLDSDASPPTPHLDQLLPGLSWIWYSLLYELVETYNDTLSRQLLIKTDFHGICSDMQLHGVDLQTAGGRRENKMAINSALQNLRRMVDEALPKFLTGGKYLGFS